MSWSGTVKAKIPIATSWRSGAGTQCSCSEESSKLPTNKARNPTGSGEAIGRSMIRVASWARNRSGWAGRGTLDISQPPPPRLDQHHSALYRVGSQLSTSLSTLSALPSTRRSTRSLSGTISDEVR